MYNFLNIQKSVKKSVYEYLGTFPTQNQNFFRTNPETMDKMRAKVGKDRPQVVYADQLQNDTSINQPRDTIQVAVVYLYNR
jgi:hypothetical protein